MRHLDPATAPSSFLQVSGTRIHYRMFNPEDIRKPGMLFVHGMWAHSHWWDHIVPFFVDHYRVVCLDLSGMGDSGHRKHYSARSYAEELIAVIEQAGIEPAVIVAHSFGGIPTAFACHMSPASVSRAIIVDSRMCIPDVLAISTAEERHLQISRKNYATPEEAIARYRLVPSQDGVDPELLRHIAALGLRSEGAGWTWKFDPAIDPLLRGDPDRIIPGEITTAIDYVYGERSDVVTPSMAMQVQAYFENCGAPICMPGAHHHILLEEPINLVSVIRSILARLPGYPARIGIPAGNGSGDHKSIGSESLR